MKNLHKKIGIVICVFMFIACFFGSLSLVKNEINLFTNPKVNTNVNVDLKTKYQNLFDFIDENKNYTNITAVGDVFALGSGKSTSVYFNPDTKEVVEANDSTITRLFKEIHYHLIPSSILPDMISSFTKPTLKAVMSVFAFGMIICVITGIIIHKNRFKDFFTIRKKPGIFNYDMHILLGIAAGIMLVWFSFSAIAINYSRPIISAFTGVKMEKPHYNSSKKELDEKVKNAKIDFDFYFANGLIKDGTSISVDYDKKTISFDYYKLGHNATKQNLYFDFDTDKVLLSKDTSKSYNLFTLSKDFHELKSANPTIRYLVFMLGLACAFCSYFGVQLNKKYAKIGNAVCGGAVFGVLLYLLANQITGGAKTFEMIAFFGGWILFYFVPKKLLVFAVISFIIAILNLILYPSGYGSTLFLILGLMFEFMHIFKEKFLTKVAK